MKFKFVTLSLVLALGFGSGAILNLNGGICVVQAMEGRVLSVAEKEKAFKSLLDSFKEFSEYLGKLKDSVNRDRVTKIEDVVDLYRQISESVKYRNLRKILTVKEFSTTNFSDFADEELVNGEYLEFYRETLKKVKEFATDYLKCIGFDDMSYDEVVQAIGDMKFNGNENQRAFLLERINISRNSEGADKRAGFEKFWDEISSYNSSNMKSFLELNAIAQGSLLKSFLDNFTNLLIGVPSSVDDIIKSYEHFLADYDRQKELYDNRKKKEEDDRKKKEEEDRKKKEEEERKRIEEEEKRKKEDEERRKKEDEERRKKEEADKAAEEDRKKKEAEEERKRKLKEMRSKILNTNNEIKINNKIERKDSFNQRKGKASATFKRKGSFGEKKELELKEKIDLASKERELAKRKVEEIKKELEKAKEKKAKLSVTGGFKTKKHVEAEKELIKLEKKFRRKELDFKKNELRLKELLLEKEVSEVKRKENPEYLKEKKGKIKEIEEIEQEKDLLIEEEKQMNKDFSKYERKLKELDNYAFLNLFYEEKAKETKKEKLSKEEATNKSDIDEFFKKRKREACFSKVQKLLMDFSTYMKDRAGYNDTSASGLCKNQDLLKKISNLVSEYKTAYSDDFDLQKKWFYNLTSALLKEIKNAVTGLFSKRMDKGFNAFRESALLNALNDISLILSIDESDPLQEQKKQTVTSLGTDLQQFSDEGFLKKDIEKANIMKRDFRNNKERLLYLAEKIHSLCRSTTLGIEGLKNLNEFLEEFFGVFKKVKNDEDSEVKKNLKEKIDFEGFVFDEGLLNNVKEIFGSVFNDLQNNSGVFQVFSMHHDFYNSLMNSAKGKLSEIYSVLNNGQNIYINDRVNPKFEELQQRAESIANFGKQVFSGESQYQNGLIEDFLGMLNSLNEWFSENGYMNELGESYYEPCLEKLNDLLNFIASDDFNFDVVKEKAPQIKEVFNKFFSFDSSYTKHQSLYDAVLNNLDEQKQAIKRGLIEDVGMTKEEFENCKRTAFLVGEGVNYVLKHNVINESVLGNLRNNLTSLNSLFKKYYDKGKTQGTYMDAYAVSSKHLSGLMQMAREKTQIFSADGGASRAFRLKLWNLIVDFCRLNPNVNSQERPLEWFNESYEQVLEEEARVERINKNKKEKGAENKPGQKKKIKFKYVRLKKKDKKNKKDVKGKKVKKDKDKKDKDKLKLTKEKLKSAKGQDKEKSKENDKDKDKKKDKVVESSKKKELKVQLPKQSLKKFVGSKDKIKIVKKHGAKKIKRVVGKFDSSKVDNITRNVRKRVANAFLVFAKKFLRELENSKGAYDLNEQFMPVISELKKSKHEDYESDLDKIELLVAGFSKFAKILRKSPKGSFNRDMGRFFNKVLAMFTSGADKESSGVSDKTDGSFYKILNYISDHDKGEGLKREEANEVFDLIKKFRDNYKNVLEGMKELSKKKKKKKKKKKRIVAKELEKIKKEKVS